MTDGFYYWTYRSHPHSNEDFLYDGVLPYVPNSHIAHQMSEEMIDELDEPAVQYDLGVHIILPINRLIKNMYDVENVQDISFDDIDVSSVKAEVRNEITEDDVLEVGKRQEKIDRHQMGEDVDGVLDVKR